jgi:hypothetical protein
MRRTVKMAKAGIPKAGQMRPGRFLGFRNPHWHETARIDGLDKFDRPIIRWTPQPMYVVHPVRAARKAKDKK